jgi:amidase
MGLLSRDGIIPTSLSLDVAGPIARSVTGAAIMLDTMAGTDPDDSATQASKGRTFDFLAALNVDALRGVRIGVVGTFLGANPDVDAIFTASLESLKKEGAELIEIGLPEPLDNLWPVMEPIFDGDFGPQIEAYLASLPEGAPRTVADLIALAESEAIAGSATPLNPARIQGFRDVEASGGYQNVERRRSLEELIPAVRAALLSVLDEQNLDALVFPTLSCPASPRHDAEDDTYVCNIDDPYRPCYMASTTGFPEITVPAGFTADILPVGLSFLGRPFSEEQLIGFAFDFEQATSARRVPAYTPKLSKDENE